MGEEQCDDGNVIDGDACPATCAIPPPRNPFLADSLVPIPHGDSAQSDSVALAGPTGPTRALAEEDLSYQHLGPGHFGIAISPEYPDGPRVIWSNGGDRISKLDYDTLAVLAEYTLPGKTLQSATTADAEIAQLDALSGEALALQGVVASAKYLTGLACVYYLLDADNTLFVGGPTSILAYLDLKPWESVLCKDCGLAVHDFIANQLQLGNSLESEKPGRKTK